MRMPPISWARSDRQRARRQKGSPVSPTTCSRPWTLCSAACGTGRCGAPFANGETLPNARGNGVRWRGFPTASSRISASRATRSNSYYGKVDGAKATAASKQSPSRPVAKRACGIIARMSLIRGRQSRYAMERRCAQFFSRLWQPQAFWQAQWLRGKRMPPCRSGAAGQRCARATGHQCLRHEWLRARANAARGEASKGHFRSGPDLNDHRSDRIPSLAWDDLGWL
jgi:hypothetical protein